ncbi:MAG: lytic transglycosylase domain-containing protein [Dongiaceae bacterium]
MTRLLALLCFLTFAWTAQAGEPRTMMDCSNEAGRTYKVPPLLLQAIAWVESGYKEDAARQNTNGSVDTGVMQINSLWLKPLAAYGIEQQHLYDACLNISVGAWILRKQIKEVGYNWLAVAQYHSRNSLRGEDYARKVARIYYRLKKQIAAQQRVAAQ